MKAYDVMTWGVISVEADAPIMRAAQLMLEHKISGLPVLDVEGRLVGLVTEGDFIRRSDVGTQCRRPPWPEYLIGPGRLTSEYVRACKRKVNEIMTPNPFSATGNAPLEEVVQVMEKHRINHLPIMEDNQVIGMVTSADLMHVFIGLARKTKAQAGTDAAIGQKILDECNRQPSVPQINASVGDGGVDFT
jgi:CBS domain-containing protein